MASAMTLTTKSSSSLKTSSKHSSPILNEIESYSPTSTTLSPQSINSISSPDKSTLSYETNQSVNLIDYFVVCGLDKANEIELTNELSISDQQQPLNPFQCSYRCRVLSHYPNEVLNNLFDEDAISRLSMPNNVSIKLNSIDPPITHPFLITRLDGTRYFGVALTFYEQILFDDLENDSFKGISSLNQIIEKYNQNNSNNRRSSSTSSIYASKAICLIGPQPHYSTFKKILEYLYQMTIDHDLLGKPIEDHLYNLLHELILPSPAFSHSVLQFNVGERQLTVWQPSLNEDDLPLLDFHLLDLFNLLSIQGVLDLVTCALLEHQIILKSSDYTRLMLVAECLTSLLFPFQWTLLYVPIVFTAALVCLDVPVPAIMGIHLNKSNLNENSSFDDHENDCSSDTSDETTFEIQRCVVYIDKGEIHLPEDMPTFPDRDLFIQELTNIISKFENQFNFEYSKKKSEDWTHIDQSQALSRIEAIAKRTGILTENFDEKINENRCLFNENELNQIIANNCIRAAFVNRFAQLFSHIDAFICYPPTGKYSNVDQWLAQRSTTKNFDRTMFIADQPKPYVPFLLAFMETQSFVSFVDAKISQRFNDDNHTFDISHKYLQYFSERTRLYRNRRDLTYQSCQTIEKIEEETRRQFNPPFAPTLNLIVAPPVLALNHSNSRREKQNLYLFEDLNGILLESNKKFPSSPLSSNGSIQRNSPINRSFQKKHPSRRTRIKKQQTVATSEYQHVQLVENEVVFQQLLKECTTKTKRMVIEKMEDVVQGSTQIRNMDSSSSSMVNLEENVLIAGFCDLLERIWSHGLHHKPNGKSAIWNYIKSFVKLNSYESVQIKPGTLPIHLIKDENPALVWCLGRKQLGNRSVSASRSESPNSHRSHTLPRLPLNQGRSSPLSIMTSSTINLNSSEKSISNHFSLIHDYRSIESCFGHNPVSVSASEIGFARAFVRLSLERRLLSRHLSELFSHSDLLQALYKRDAFLRADDGDYRKQFLAHVESLQLLDYKCFSNSYADIDIIYHVTIVPIKTRPTGISSTTTANPYIALAGLLGSTKIIPVPSKNTLEMKFRHKNLGQLTTLRIGHDNSGLMPRWNVDYVLVRNQLTNNIYRFPCGRWLGKGVDDDSLERLLFVDTEGSFELNENANNNSITDSGSPSQLMTTSMIAGGSQSNLSITGRSRSPSLRRANDHKFVFNWFSENFQKRQNQSNQQADDIYELLGRSINQLVKYFDEPEKKRGLITPILCGEDGLVNALEKTLSFGLKKTSGTVAFFGGGRKRYVWDFLIKVCDEYDGRRSQWQKTSKEKAIICYINGVRSIEKALSTFGKDGRFQSWCCLACKLHLLSDWFELLSRCSDTCLQQFYDPINNCFRQEKLNQFITNILQPVKDFDFAHLEPALLKGLAGV